MNKTYNILVFPGGTENGLEIYKSLKYCKEITLFSASSNVTNHAEFVFENHNYIPEIYDPNWLIEFNDLIKKNNIDYIFPANDFVIDKLVQFRSQISSKIILPESSVVEIIRSKKLTYNFFKTIIPVPKLISKKENLKFPLFSKPDNGYGSKGIKIINNLNDLKEIEKNHVITEFLPGIEYSVDCFTDSNGNLLYSKARTRDRIRMGTSMSSKLIDSDSVIYEIANKINGNLKLIGAWFFQLKESENGTLKLLEISPRIAGTMAMNRVRGVNFPLLSIFAHEKLEISLLLNNTNYIIDRSLTNRYKHNFKFNKVYVDLDDTIIVKGKINIQIIQFLFQCINTNKRIILLTKSLQNNLNKFLKSKRLTALFDEIIHIEESDLKSNYINKNDKAIFIDDSFSQRSEVSGKCNIPTFDPSMIEILLDDRAY